MTGSSTPAGPTAEAMGAVPAEAMGAVPAEATGVEPAGEPTPWDPPMLPFAIGGTAVWAVAGLAILPFLDRLSAAGRGGWIWICLAGFLLGLVGIAVMTRHDASRRSPAARPPAAD